MNHSDQINEIAKALSEFQGEVQNAIKGSKNPFFNSMYADLGEILNTVRPLLGKCGLSIAQFPAYNGDHNGGVVVLETLLAHSSGQWYSGITSSPVFPTTGKTGKVELVSAQTIGSATTYCRRYAIAAMLGIGQEDSDGEGFSGHDAAPKDKPKDAVPERAEAPSWTPAETQEWDSLMTKAGSHLRVQNRLDDLEAFVARVTTAKGSYPPTLLLPQLRDREKEYAAQAEAFVKANSEPLVQIDLL
jgi:hypothetical protein